MQRGHGDAQLTDCVKSVNIHTNNHGANPCGIDSPAPYDDDGHGTHTISSDGGATQIGIAPGAQFIGCRNMDNGFGTPTYWTVSGTHVGADTMVGDYTATPRD